MKKKTTINDILNELDFSKPEKDGFIECINTVKEGQKNETINAEALMEEIIRGVAGNEDT